MKIRMMVVLVCTILVAAQAVAEDGFIEACHTGNVNLAAAFFEVIKDDKGLANYRDKIGSPVLNLAAMGGHIQMMELLLAKGADIEGKADMTGTTALIDASSSGKVEAVAFLLKKGARVNNTDAAGKTALYWATSYERNNVIEILIKAGAK